MFSSFQRSSAEEIHSPSSRAGSCPQLEHLNVEGSWGVGNQGLAALAGQDGGMVGKTFLNVVVIILKREKL